MCALLGDYGRRLEAKHVLFVGGCMFLREMANVRL